jgi:hypothetical protein
MSDGSGINLLRKFEPVSARLREADQFFEPCRTRSLEMQAGVELRQRPADDRIEREFVAAAVDAELKIRR